jgi:two-component system, chemotaxis family, response regulator Rcp1
MLDGGKRILLVEDNPADVYILKHAFEQECTEPLTFEVAEDGEAALEHLLRMVAAREEKADLIMLDLNLPKVSGQEVLEALKAHTLLRIIPVIVFSSSVAASDVEQAYNAFANCYIRKPSTLDGIFKIARQICDFWLRKSALPTFPR